jgi:hypothetical protein
MTTNRDDMTDPVLTQLLREAADESPPAHVDAAILAEARRAVEPARQPRSMSAPLWRWLLPLGAAVTIAAIVVSVRPLAPTPVEETASDVTVPPGQVDQRPSVERAARAAPATSANALRPAPAKRQDAAAKPQESGSANSRSIAIAPERAVPSEKQEARKATAATAPLASTQAAAAPAAAAPQRENAAVRADAAHDAAAWIERIRALLRESRRDEAAQELERFRAEFTDADARLPDDLRAFAAQAHAKPAAPR